MLTLILLILLITCILCTTPKNLRSTPYVSSRKKFTHKVNSFGTELQIRGPRSCDSGCLGEILTVGSVDDSA